MRITPFLLVGVLLLCNHSAAQVRVCFPEPHTLSDDLQSTLQTRLATFVTAQAQGQWDDIAKLLGNQRRFRESSYKHVVCGRNSDISDLLGNMARRDTDKSVP
jgi:hypothetical protein